MAEGVVIVAPLVGLESVTVKFSLGSIVVSPWILIVITLLISAAAKFTVPVGNTPPTKSVALAGFVPDPITAQLTELTPVVLPERFTVKVKALLPLFPSVWFALVAAIAKFVDVFSTTFRVSLLLDHWGKNWRVELIAKPVKSRLDEAFKES